ncbi:MAG: hypothetical protein FJY65_12700, partial [Calditrichaeota bacterium]|nr:hypothetical protein [Calditrichota bacterium]
MKYITQSFIIFILTAASLNAQPAVEWIRFYDNSSVDEFNDVYETAEGNYAMCGSSKMLNPNNVERSGFWLVLANLGGQMIWQRTYLNDNGNLTNWAYSLIETDDGNFALGGESYSGGNQYFSVLLVDANGDRLWWRFYNEDYNNLGECLALIETKDGPILAAGFAENENRTNRAYAVLFEQANGRVIWEQYYTPSRFYEVREKEGGFLFVGSGPGPNGWIVHTDFNGDTLWTRRYNPPQQFNALISCRGDGFAAVGPHGQNPNNRFHDTCVVIVRVNLNGELRFNAHKSFIPQNYYIVSQEMSVACPLDGGFIVVGSLQDMNLNGNYRPFIWRVDAQGDEMWSRIDRNGIGRGEDYRSVIVDRNNNGIVAGSAVTELGRGDGVLVKIVPDFSPPLIIARTPADTLLKVLRGDSIFFDVEVFDRQGDSIRYIWRVNAALFSTDTSATIPFDSVGNYQVKCIVSDGDLFDSTAWSVKARNLYIHSQTPDTLNLIIRRNTVVSFSIDSIAYIDDGRGRPAYRWSLIDRLDDDRREEV